MCKTSSFLICSRSLARNLAEWRWFVKYCDEGRSEKNPSPHALSITFFHDPHGDETRAATIDSKEANYPATDEELHETYSFGDGDNVSSGILSVNPGKQWKRDCGAKVACSVPDTHNARHMNIPFIFSQRFPLLSLARLRNMTTVHYCDHCRSKSSFSSSLHNAALLCIPV